MRLNQLIKELNKIYIKEKTPKWDNIGWQLDKPNKKEKIKNILLCLDLNNKAIDQAIKDSCNLIITHHPFIFGKRKQNYKDFYKLKIINKIKKNNIFVYSIHTNFDASKYGMNYNAAHNIFKNTKYKIVNSKNIHKEIIFEKEINIKDIIQNIKKINNIKHIMTNFDESKYNLNFKNVYICMGSGGFLVNLVPENSLIIVGDFKWNEIIKLTAQNSYILSIGHHYESIFNNIIKNQIQKINNNISIKTLTINDPIHII